MRAISQNLDKRHLGKVRCWDEAGLLATSQLQCPVSKRDMSEQWGGKNCDLTYPFQSLHYFRFVLVSSTWQLSKALNRELGAIE